MIAILICAVWFCVCYAACRRSLPFGIVTVVAAGYAYGITRANVITTMSHFTFDAAIFGCYLAVFTGRLGVWSKTPQELKTWFAILIAWPCLIALLPFQTPMITAVGLRGNIYFLPVLLIGAHLTNRDMSKVAVGLAGLNLVALGFAGAEYVLGLERFYPRSPVTTIIYISRDVGEGFYRIVATFANAHSYAGTMVATVPVLLGAMIHSRLSSWGKLMIGLGLVSATAGVLFAATRLNFVMMACLSGYAMFKAGVAPKYRVLILVVLLGAGAVIATNSRMNRFETLKDTDMVSRRINGSVNRTFLEVLVSYPMGNGLGGGGTSIPYFLQGDVRRPVAIESEYGRILLEQGIIGLLLWFGFIIFVLIRGFHAGYRGWPSARRICWVLILFVFGTSAIGTGLLTAIPSTFLWLLMIGWMIAGPHDQPFRRHAPSRQGIADARIFSRPAIASVEGGSAR